MLIKKAPDIRSSEITPQSLYLDRRKFLAGAAITAAAVSAGASLRQLISPAAVAQAGNKIDGVKKSPFSTTETITPFNDVTHYNNYYEFGTGKSDPARYAGTLKTRPWTVTVEGECQAPGQIDLDGPDVIAAAPAARSSEQPAAD